MAPILEGAESSRSLGVHPKESRNSRPIPGWVYTTKHAAFWGHFHEWFCDITDVLCATFWAKARPSRPWSLGSSCANNGAQTCGGQAFKEPCHIRMNEVNSRPCLVRLWAAKHAAFDEHLIHYSHCILNCELKLQRQPPILKEKCTTNGLWTETWSSLGLRITEALRFANKFAAHYWREPDLIWLLDTRPSMII